MAKDKITYLFGAGASAGTKGRQGLPVVDQLPERIDFLVQKIRTEDLWLSEVETPLPIETYSKEEYQRQIIQDLEWVSIEAKKHASVDTLAKKMYLKEEFKSLDRLKVALSIFFILEQSRVEPDIRYDTFFASILNETLFEFPNDVRILSWNYDYQFEKAFSGFSGRSNLSENERRLNVIAKFYRGTPSSDRFAIVKLNGTTGFSNGMKLVKFTDVLSQNFDLELLDKVVYQYANMSHKVNNGFYPTLSFAWEKEEPGNTSIIEKAIACTNETDVLVVIGYSFPFFNRFVDRNIIGEMKKLRKVYFQSPDAENIKTRFQSVRGDIDPKYLIPYTDVQSFLLPDEM